MLQYQHSIGAFSALDIFARTILLYKLAMSAVGLGVFILGLWLFFHQSKDESKRSTFEARLTAGLSFSVIGIATLLYAWLWFEKFL